MRGPSTRCQAVIALLAVLGPGCGRAADDARPPVPVTSIDVVIDGDLEDVWKTARETLARHDVQLEPILFMSSETTFRLGDDEVRVALRRADERTPKKHRTLILVRTAGPMSVTRAILEELREDQRKAGRASPSSTAGAPGSKPG